VKPQGYIPPDASPSAHEGADLHTRNVVKVTGILVGALGISILVLVLFFRHMEKKYPNRTSEAAPVIQDSQLPPAPRLQTHPLRDLQAVRDVENSHLDHYAWVDRQQGIAQIPIDRAMILWAKNDSSPSPSPTATTNSAPLSGTTELPMRQQKAREAPHAP
jgi:hypothetical protein